MKRLAIVWGLVSAPAFAQDQPQVVTIPASAVEHTLLYLRGGGTRAEADALADQILSAARADVAKRNEAVKPDPAMK